MEYATLVINTENWFENAARGTEILWNLAD